MRTTEEMYSLIMQYAMQDERVRVVTLEGSRTNEKVPTDMFQDFDISFFVTDMASYLLDHRWVDQFGSRIMMQMPDAGTWIDAGDVECFSYLMLYTDGNRIDLSLYPLTVMPQYCQSDKLIRTLLDKDHIMPKLPPASDEDYWVKKPSANEYAACCNEFWWIATNVAKGLWRRETLYAMDHLQLYMRPMIMHMLSWKVGMETDFSLSVGKNYKYLQSYIEEEQWQALMRTFPSGNNEAIWQSLMEMTDLFRHNAKEVGERLGYCYEEEDDSNVTAYLHHVRYLPQIATAIYTGKVSYY
ncbi:aminoglycoside 6-adenylyltransferase [Paenibacillus yanchengensis]|uniref:Aminoglycoside 6-adenylyltransferase n=1 Tax=Paenibacillus yanchengensis TaxID=2035833 RepID=A0ABW4YJX2_9BACL